MYVVSDGGEQAVCDGHLVMRLCNSGLYKVVENYCLRCAMVVNKGNVKDVDGDGGLRT